MEDNQEPLLSLEDIAKRDAEVEKYGSLPQQALAGVEGLARGATFGLSDIPLAAIDKEGVAKRREYNPITSTIGEVGGVVAPALMSGGTNILARTAQKLGIAEAAQIVGKPVEAISSIGRIGEDFALKSFASEAAKTPVRQILEKAAAKGLGSAIEGAFYGAGQVVSEAALGDPKIAAENALATIGLSTILSGGIGSAIPLAGAAVKSVAQSAGKSIPKLKSVFTGVSADVEKTVLNKMPEIQQMAEKGTSAESAYLTHFSEELPKIDSMKSTFLDDAIKARQAVLDTNKVSTSVTSVENLYKAIDEAKKSITPRGKALTSKIEGRVAEVLDAERRLDQDVAETMGISVADVKKLPPEQRLLSGTALNDLNRQYYNSIDWGDSLGVATEVNSMFKKMGYQAAESLAKIDNGVRIINKKMSRAIEAQEALKNYGLYNQRGIDTEKFVKFVNDNDKKWFFNKSHLQTLDEIWGTNLVDQVEIARAMKQIYPKDVFGAYATGRSLLESAGGAGLGLAVGGPVGAGVGIAAGMALQAPGLRQFRIKAANALENLVSGKEASAITRLGGGIGKVVPDRLVPFISAKVSALSQLERAQNSVQNAINAGASSVFKNEDVMAEPTSIEALNKTNFGRGQVRPSEDRLAAFRKRAEEINDLMNNPSKLSDLVAKNTQDLHLIAPQVAQHIIEHGMNAVQALHAALPKTNANDPLKPGKVSDPSDFELSRFERVVDTIENPMRVLKDIKDGTMTQDQVTILKNVYPTIYMNMVNAIQIRAARVKEIPYGVRLKIATLLGQPTMTAQRPGVLRVLQTPATPDQVQKMKSPDMAGARETQVEGVLRR